jgi:hypothetical protein
MFALNWLTGFRGEESYVKTMSADGGHLGWRSGSLDIILKVENPMGKLFKSLLL